MHRKLLTFKNFSGDTKHWVYFCGHLCIQSIHFLPLVDFWEATFIWNVQRRLEWVWVLSIWLDTWGIQSIYRVLRKLLLIFRMTPALLAIILIHTSLVKFASTGPYGFFTNNYLAIHCRKTWWSAFFFFTKIMNFKMVDTTWVWFVDIHDSVVVWHASLVLSSR